MRVSSKMLSRQVMTNLNSLYKNLAKSHSQVSTGDKFQKASQMPIAAVRSMDLSIDLKRNEQYSANIDRASSIYAETENSLMAISNSIQGIKDNLLRASHGSYNQEDREVIAKEVMQLSDNILTQLNKEYSGKFYFGGFNTSSAPFVKNIEGEIEYNGIELAKIEKDSSSYKELVAEDIQVKTGKSTEIGISLPGIKVVACGEDNLFGKIDEILSELNSEDADFDKLNKLIEDMDGFFTKTQNHISTIGAKANNLNVMKDQSEQIQLNLEETLSKESHIDIEEAIINYKTNEMVYNSALAVAAKIIQPTLIDFLR